MKNTSEECLKGHVGEMRPIKSRPTNYYCLRCMRDRQKELTRTRNEKGLTAKGAVKQVKPTLREKFEGISTLIDTDECVPWGKDWTDQGYGRFYFEGHYYQAHRVAYELWVGAIPEGLVIDHTCHNDTDCVEGINCPHRKCVNPKHLEAITPSENTRRGNSMSSVQRRRTSCAKGHEYVGDNFYIRPYKGGTRRVCRICEREASRRKYWRDKAKSEHK